MTLEELAKTSPRINFAGVTIDLAGLIRDRQDLVEATEILQAHQDAHGLAVSHEGDPNTSRSWSEHVAAQEWRVRRDAWLAR